MLLRNVVGFDICLSSECFALKTEDPEVYFPNPSVAESGALTSQKQKYIHSYSSRLTQGISKRGNEMLFDSTVISEGFKGLPLALRSVMLRRRC